MSEQDASKSTQLKGKYVAVSMAAKQRSVCRDCKEDFNEGELRMQLYHKKAGKKQHDGFHHPHCFGKNHPEFKLEASKIEGLDELQDEHRKTMLQLATGESANFVDLSKKEKAKGHAGKGESAKSAA